MYSRERQYLQERRRRTRRTRRTRTRRRGRGGAGGCWRKHWSVRDNKYLSEAATESTVRSDCSGH